MKSSLAILAAYASLATAATTHADVPGVIFPEGSCAASCGTATDKASGVSVSVSPCTYDPSNPTPVTIDLSYTLNEVVTSGSQTVTLKYDGLQVSDKTVDLCTGGVLANDTKVPCPTPAVPFKGGSSTTMTPPKGAPAGTYIGRQTWEDQNGDQILCLAYVLSVSSGGNQTSTSNTNKK